MDDLRISDATGNEEPADLASLILRLSAARGIEDVMAVVRKGARCLLKADGATFVLREEDRCFYADEDAIGPLWKGQRFPMEICVSGWAMKNGRPAVVSDIFSDPRIPIEAYRPTFVRSLIMVPIGKRDAPGAIGAYWSKARSFSDEEVALLSAIGDAASVALVNASLYRTLARSAEIANRRAEELERLSASKARFLAAASHDMRQPFQAMRLFHSLLTAQVTDEKAQKTLKHLDEAMVAGETLLGAILELSTLDAGIVAVTVADFRLGPLFDELEAGQGPKAGEKGLSLHKVASSLLIRTDRALLSRALTLLLDNALHFSPSGKVLLGCRREGGYARIIVQDQGIGIPAGEHAAIFETFYQVGNTARDKQEGLGLGLAIVAKICALLGHEVAVKSIPGRGSVFSIMVPRTIPA